MPDVEKLNEKDRAALLGCVKGKNEKWSADNDGNEVPADLNQRYFTECAESLGLENYTVEYEKTELQTATLLGREILAAGTWTSNSGVKKTYTVADLDGMVAAFNALMKRLPPYVKLGHTTVKDHKAFAGQPAVGWISTMKRVGTKILADFVKVPKRIADFIEAGTYRRISPEVYHNLKDEATGKVYKHYIGAAALLGAGWGAMTSLKDVQDLFGIDGKDAISDYELPEWVSAGQAQPAEVFMAQDIVEPNKGGEQMDEKEVKALIDAAVEPLAKEHADFQANIAEVLGIEPDADPVKAISALKVANKVAGEAIAERDATEFEAKLDAVIEKAKADGKLLPAREKADRLMFDGWKATADEDGKVSFELADNKTEGTLIECAAAWYDAQPKVIELGKELGGNGLTKGKKGGDATLPVSVVRQLGTTGVPIGVTGGGDINDQVVKYQSENKCDFMVAFEAVTGLAPGVEPDASMFTINDKTDELTMKK